MGNSVMFVKGVNNSTFFSAHEKQLKSLIPEGFVLPDWEDSCGVFFWNLQKETPEYELWDVHCHLHKMGDNEHDYVLHYPSKQMTVSPLHDAVGYHCIFDPNFLCLGWGSTHYKGQGGEIVFEDQYEKAREGVSYKNICTLEGLPKTLRDAIGDFFEKFPNGEVHDFFDEHFRRTGIDFIKK